MPRLRYVGKDPETGESIWVDLREAQDEARKRSANVIEDTVEPFMSHATAEGKMFDSMSAYKQHLEDNGMEITGGDHLTGNTVENHRYKADRNAINATVREAMRRVEWGMEPFNEKEKHECQIEAERMKR